MSQQETTKRGSFRGTFGFIMAAVGSAVGLGNIWRFPYLAARDGGGLFLIIYLVLAVTFGFALLATEIAIGRKTRRSPLKAYAVLHRKSGWIGTIACLVPMIILPYYCVIGGWVLKYLTAFATGRGAAAASEGYFDAFITARGEPVIFLVIFLAMCALVVFIGVDKGIERFSKILMPVLVVMILGIAIYALTLRKKMTPEQIVTGLDGLRVFLIPSFEGITISSLFRTIVDALTQLFFSISIAMGIMVTYGSYVPDDTNLLHSIGMIEIFDALVAFLAGVMIIPAVYVFLGPEAMTKGPSLMFISLPNIFAEMGIVGDIIGSVFFFMVLFAAVTSGISLMEAVVSSLMEQFRWSRKKAVIVESLIALAIGLIICFGYNYLYFDIRLPNGAQAQILDVLDYLSNNILMPVVAMATCILIGWIVKPDAVTDEITKNGGNFRRKNLYVAMIRYIAPVLITLILLTSFGVF